MIYSFWKITHDPTGTPRDILNFLDPIEEELKLVPVQGVEVIELVDVDAAFLRRTPGSSYTLTFTRERTFATDLAARREMLDRVTQHLPNLTLKPIRLEIMDDATRYYQFANAFVTITETRRKVESAKPRILETVSITGTGLTRTLTP